ncbi:HAD-IIB family hydrolase [Mesomycoplasma conjunctivae]|uniref:HAD-IIB family hydrolase n=1 Tax=Mesomycoplasma conjunctivae TaxID=45361 RepID=UPI003DA38490
MNKKKIVFLDLDGTLLDIGYGVTANMSNINKKAVQKISQNYTIVISTGRKLSEKIKKIGQQINAKYYICQNGANIFDKNFNLLRKYEITDIIANDVIKLAFDNKSTVAFDEKYIYGDGLWKTIFSFFAEFKPRPISLIEVKQIQKILIISAYKSRIRIIKNILKQRYQGQLQVSISGKGFALEITNSQASKGKAAKFIAELEGVDLKNTFHIGDSMNDASCSGIIGNLIAMKSGSKNLQKIADNVGFAKYGGVAKAIEKFIDKNISVAVVGQYGSGKTTFLKEVEKFGYQVLYTDDFFASCYQNGNPCYSVVKSISEDFVTTDYVKKDKIRDFMLEKKENKDFLEKKLYKILSNHLKSRRYDFVEIPNLYTKNANFAEFFQKIVLVSTNPEQRQKNILNKNVALNVSQKNEQLNQIIYKNIDFEVHGDEWKNPEFFNHFFNEIFK